MGESQTTDIGLPLFLLMAGIVGMLLLAVGIIFFFVLYQKRLLAQREQMRLQELVYQKDLLQTAVAAEEAERKRIAHDLHDGVGSSLSTTKLFLNQLQQHIPSIDYQSIKTETSDLLNDTIANVRNIVRNLAPPSLEKFGLIAAVQDLCQRIKDTGMFEMHFHYNQNRRLESAQEVALYRILQELINNTIKHAEASTIHIHISFLGKHLELTYQDNGKGFDHPKEHSNGLGLKSIESRISTIKGKINYQSANNQGVCVKITLEIV